MNFLLNFFKGLAVLLLFAVVSCNEAPVVDVSSNNTDGDSQGEVIGENIISIKTKRTAVALIRGEVVEVPFVVSLKKIAKEEVSLKLKLNTDASEFEVSLLGGSEVVIPVGEKSYMGAIRFNADAFSYDMCRNVEMKLTTTAFTIDSDNSKINIQAEKPTLIRPGIKYAIPSNGFACSASVSVFSIGGIAFRKIYDTQAAYEDLSKNYVACLAPGKNKFVMITDIGSANASWKKYKLKMALWGDWNGDGDFADEDEQAIYESWIQTSEHYVRHEFEFTMPEDAVKSSTVRMGIFEEDAGTENMDDGSGAMVNGNIKDISYLKVISPVALKPTEEADQPVFSKYCKTVEFFYSYAEIRTFDLNGTTIVESKKGDPLSNKGISQRSIEESTGDETAWDGWGSKERLNYVLNIKKGESNTFEFTAERHIDFSACDQRYKAIIFVDWNGDNDFADEGEEILHSEWFAEWLDRSHPVKFIGYLTPPANAVKSSRIRFGVYQNSQGYIECGCGGGNNTDFMDILYKIEN
ncbi:MAG: hypothetical protein IMY73_01525 [Bacteroidetes bacterium]|nr:hypothetical protein [Bacteroidota bacterium]